MLDYVTGDLHATESHKIKKPWILDVVDQMVLSASGFQTLPTNAGTETSLGLSHTCGGSHTRFLHYSCVIPHTHKRTEDCLFPQSPGVEKTFRVGLYRAICL